ncbi:respiratory nitrate reductase delta chain [Corynebacterium kutscheri]|uniref:Respiratory nitrate reductase delta chain n=1 Tax=Corynebacterium kutscheri TaxID=35755 RepID=A0AB38VV40_9CORY|nr:nitrate reductase molybdenum cofactor assembly chaperone [Corynebacterium kutscheri]VEH05683.1 respiratory nitrate reductase delta chain [Corynebacterium kutscheri]VEH81578.1 respiratory nitrate reductase delta chain [Corynebacterium kutscheri]
MNAVIFQAAGLLLSYPDEELIERLPMIEQAVAEVGAADAFAPTIAHLRSLSLMDAQSWHVQEFDLSRRHALHLTYWTDGDTRRRGEVLLAIKQTYRDSGLLVDLDGELPDYLPMVLEFAATGDPELGVGILNTYRASLELLRMSLSDDKLPQAAILEVICQTLGGASPKTRAEVQQLLQEPPQETVGLHDPVLLPYPKVQGSTS